MTTHQLTPSTTTGSSFPLSCSSSYTSAPSAASSSSSLLLCLTELQKLCDPHESDIVQHFRVQQESTHREICYSILSQSIDFDYDSHLGDLAWPMCVSKCKAQEPPAHHDFMLGVFIGELLDYLSAHSHQLPAMIFRSSGNLDRQKVLLEVCANRHYCVDVLQLVQLCHCSWLDVANVLKHCLKEYKLLSVKVEELLRSCFQLMEPSRRGGGGGGSHGSDQPPLQGIAQDIRVGKQVRCFRIIFQLLSAFDRLLMMKLMDLLHFIAQQHTLGMSAESLGVCFAPILFANQSEACFLNKKSTMTQIQCDLQVYHSLTAQLITMPDPFAIPAILYRHVQSHLKESDRTQLPPTTTTAMMMTTSFSSHIQQGSSTESTLQEWIQRMRSISSQEERKPKLWKQWNKVGRQTTTSTDKIRSPLSFVKKLFSKKSTSSSASSACPPPLGQDLPSFFRQSKKLRRSEARLNPQSAAKYHLHRPNRRQSSSFSYDRSDNWCMTPKMV